ncbi:MAG: hypothetical protein LUM44_01745 [Pyrinomonadaceae bacterium]|nr:hypothetical protein [Pyrinomonadaceae bacterium]
MIKQLFRLFLIAVVLSFPSFGQISDGNSIQQFSPDFSALSKLFLPPEKDAWTITLTREGGMFGQQPRFVGLVNSRGDFVCQDKVKKLDAAPLAEISALMLSSDFKKIRKTFKPTPSFCKDCFVTNMTIKYKHKTNKHKTYEFSWFTIPAFNPEIEQIFEKTKAFAVCQ